MGTLNVYAGSIKVFSTSGNHGNRWNVAQIPVNGSNSLVRFFIVTILDKIDFFLLLNSEETLIHSFITSTRDYLNTIQIVLFKIFFDFGVGVGG